MEEYKYINKILVSLLDYNYVWYIAVHNVTKHLINSYIVIIIITMFTIIITKLGIVTTHLQ